MNEYTRTSLLQDIDNLHLSGITPSRHIGLICELLAARIPRYDWVGVYRIGESGNQLVLGPYAGAPTEHIRIPFGRGVCGRAASEKRTILVQDVSREANYLSCSIKVKSEIVVPILGNGTLLGVLDIDSHEINAFGEEDVRLLEQVARTLSPMLMQNP